MIDHGRVQPALSAEEWAAILNGDDCEWPDEHALPVTLNFGAETLRDWSWQEAMTEAELLAITWEEDDLLREQHRLPDRECVQVGADDNVVDVGLPKVRHALAALCLYGQPFGFTWDDVRFLRAEAENARKFHGDLIAESFDFDGVADRIAALLPEPT